MPALPTDIIRATRPAKVVVWPDVSPAELVTNGTFDADANWTKGTNWTITGGQAVASSVPAFQAISQAISITAGVDYDVSIDAVVTSGSASLYLGSSGDADVRIALNSTGTYTATITAKATATVLVRAEGSGFTGTLDNISVQETGPSVPTNGRDGLRDIDPGFFESAADALTVLGLKGALIASFRRRFTVECQGEVSVDPTTEIPSYQIVDSELAADLPAMLTRYQYDMETETTAMEVLG